eukprot:2520735-Rhodomonas_salina.3
MQVHNTLYNTSENTLVAAPAGSGTTALLSTVLVDRGHCYDVDRGHCYDIFLLRSLSFCTVLCNRYSGCGYCTELGRMVRPGKTICAEFALLRAFNEGICPPPYPSQIKTHSLKSNTISARFVTGPCLCFREVR